MSYRYICINPHTDEVEKECNRYPHDTCCMCSGPMIALKSDVIDNLLKSLKTEGINSKQKSIELLEAMKRGL